MPHAINHCNFDNGSDRPDICRVCCGNSSQAWFQCLELWECIKVSQGCVIPRGTEVFHTFDAPFLVGCPNLCQDFSAIVVRRGQDFWQRRDRRRVQHIEHESRTGGRQVFREVKGQKPPSVTHVKVRQVKDQGRWALPCYFRRSRSICVTRSDASGIWLDRTF